MRFRATILLGGKTATGIPVPDDVMGSLAAGNRPAVTVTLNGLSYRSTAARMGGLFMVPLSAERREAAGVAAGDEVDVDIEVDREPRQVEVPPDLVQALAGNAAAKDFFDALSYSHQSSYVAWIEAAKKQDTRDGRVPPQWRYWRRGDAEAEADSGCGSAGAADRLGVGSDADGTSRGAAQASDRLRSAAGCGAAW